MTSTARIQPAPVTGAFGMVVKRFSKRMLGEVPEPVGVYTSMPTTRAWTSTRQA